MSYISRGLNSHHTGTVPLCSTTGCTSSIDRTSTSGAYGDGDFDLHRATTGKGGHADGAAGVAAGVAEDVTEDVAGTVDHRRLLDEARRRRHVAGHAQHPFDQIQRPQLGPQDGEGVEGAHPSGGVPLLDADAVAEHAGAD